MNKPLKPRQTKVESAPEFGNSLEVESSSSPGPHAEVEGNLRSSAEVADPDPVDSDAADGERPYEFDEEGDGPGRIAALPVDDRYEEIKRGEIHIAELQRMTMQQLLAQARK